MADQEGANIMNTSTTESCHQTTCQILVLKGKCSKQNPVLSGVVWVIEHLESHGIQGYPFLRPVEPWNLNVGHESHAK